MLRIDSELAAAALAYFFKNDCQHNVLIYNMGGCTLDVSILTAEGDTHSGGEDFGDFHNKIADCSTQDFKRKDRGNDLVGNFRALMFSELNGPVEKCLRGRGNVHDVVIDNPDKPVPFGAAAQAAILSGQGILKCKIFC